MGAVSVYSFGPDSPLKLELPDKVANLYNEAAKEFFAAQVRFNQKFGRKWDPVTEPIQINWSAKQKRAWDKVGAVFNHVIERDGPFHENDIMDDFLVRNTTTAVIHAAINWGRVLHRAAVLGGVTAVLRGL